MSRTAIVLLILAMGTRAAVCAGSEAFAVSEAWVPDATDVGGNVPFLMTITNNTDAADALMRVRCAVANFSERHTIDRGEGAPAMRSIPSIPIAAKNTTTLKPDGYHVMLLQTRQVLAEGDKFTCAVVFQKAGTIETEVQVRKRP